MDVSFLEPVFAATGPFATVLADVTHTTENADTELDLRVRALTERLAGEGAPDAVVEAVRAALAEVRCFQNLEQAGATTPAADGRRQYRLEADVRCPDERRASDDNGRRRRRTSGAAAAAEGGE